MTQSDDSITCSADNPVSRPADVSASRPKFVTTAFFDGHDESYEDTEPLRNSPRLALVSINNSSAPSAEVPWSRILMPTSAAEGEPPVLTVGRHKACNVQLADPRASLHHFEVSTRRVECNDGVAAGNDALVTQDFVYECVLHDSSSNGTAVNGRIVGKGNTERLRTGDEICVLPANRVGRDKMIAFVFRNTAELLSATPEPMPVQEGQPSIPTLQRTEAQSLELEDLVLCPICMQPIYKCVALMPCFHNFCTACCSDWMRRKDECPVCRGTVAAVMKNHPMEAVIEAYLEANPDRRRDPEELQDMDARDGLDLGAGGKVVRDACWQGAGPLSPSLHAPALLGAAAPPHPPAAGHDAPGAAANPRARVNGHVRAAVLAAEGSARQADPGGRARPLARSGSQACALQ